MTSKAMKVPKTYFDRQEAASYLGVSLHYFDYLIEQSFFPVIEMPHMKKPNGKKRVKRFIRIAQSDLDGFMEFHKKLKVCENEVIKNTLADVNNV